MVKTQSKQSSQAQQATTAGSSTPELKFAGRSKRRVPTKQEMEILYGDPKIPVDDIAAYFQISKSEMYKLIDHYAIPRRDKKHNMVTPADRRKLIIEYTLGASTKELAEKYGYHMSTVCRVTKDVRRPRGSDVQPVQPVKTKEPEVKVADTVQVTVQPVAVQPIVQPVAPAPVEQSALRRLINWFKS